MKRIFSTLLISLILVGGAFAQRFVTKTGHIKFYSDTPVETIEAHNRQVNSALDIESGDFVFKVLMRGFEFEKALMQEHFNENYVESHKYPNATFVGKIMNPKEIDFGKEGTYGTTVEGDLTIHGVTRKIQEKGTFTVRGDKIIGKAKFKVLVDDYDIKIPKAVIENIAEEIEITVDVELDKLKS
ncbi:MAG: YceI family protein [Bacteroidales bacterium]|nr:YceI family protein [Bacteroidales bacterium]MCF8387736.1 YceI family protein [Bacteroidales bacterium]MCF8397552.1 YceI family protein [Bacteroidales bacterium]